MKTHITRRRQRHTHHTQETETSTAMYSLSTCSATHGPRSSAPASPFGVRLTSLKKNPYPLLFVKTKREHTMWQEESSAYTDRSNNEYIHRSDVCSVYTDRSNNEYIHRSDVCSVYTDRSNNEYIHRSDVCSLQLYIPYVPSMLLTALPLHRVTMTIQIRGVAYNCTPPPPPTHTHTHPLHAAHCLTTSSSNNDYTDQMCSLQLYTPHTSPPPCPPPYHFILGVQQLGAGSRCPNFQCLNGVVPHVGHVQDGLKARSHLLHQ